MLHPRSDGGCLLVGGWGPSAFIKTQLQMDNVITFIYGDLYGGVFLFFCDLLSQGSQRTLYGFLYACLPYWCGGPLQYGGGGVSGSYWT